MIIEEAENGVIVRIDEKMYLFTSFDKLTEFLSNRLSCWAEKKATQKIYLKNMNIKVVQLILTLGLLMVAQYSVADPKVHPEEMILSQCYTDFDGFVEQWKTLDSFQGADKDTIVQVLTNICGNALIRAQEKE